MLVSSVRCMQRSLRWISLSSRSSRKWRKQPIRRRLRLYEIKATHEHQSTST
uniref:Uncharacterized protein n=1 Tax=Arundo donax TaxID=35708 RepID=A0A0A9BML1_ARUDO